MLRKCIVRPNSISQINKNHNFNDKKLSHYKAQLLPVRTLVENYRFNATHLATEADEDHTH